MSYRNSTSVLPFVLEAMIRAGHKTGFFDKLKSNATIADALHRLDELKQAAWKTIAPDAATGAELLADDATPETLPSPTATPT